MSGEPNQQIRPNIFGQDLTYTSCTTPNDYYNRFTNSSMCYSQPNFPFISNFGNNPVSFPIPANAQLVQQAQQNIHVQSRSFGDSPFRMGYTSYQPQNVNVSYSHMNPMPSTSTYVSAGQNKFMACGVKRRTLSPPSRQAKLFITEEKMAEHLSQLSLHPDTNIRKSKEDDDKPRLYIADELRNLQSTNSIIPQVLLDRIHRPCTALVLWQPPQRIIPENVEDITDNNNEEDIQDNNLMDLGR